VGVGFLIIILFVYPAAATMRSSIGIIRSGRGIGSENRAQTECYATLLLLLFFVCVPSVFVTAQDTSAEDDLENPKYAGAASDESQLDDGNFIVILTNDTLPENLQQVIDTLVADAIQDIQESVDEIFPSNFTDGNTTFLDLFGNVTDRMERGDYVPIRSTTSYLNVFLGFVVRVDDGIISTMDESAEKSALENDFRQQVQGWQRRRRIRARILRRILQSDLVAIVEEVRIDHQWKLTGFMDICSAF
jgi:hypothetical protein